ncbi:MAG: hypothetical protein HW420_1064 [Candidatus Nitrosotenuis sp.]|nr:hypothetical protein [Candidatus Nitrosotenuis sp.]
MENKDFVDMCVICKQGVSRADMDYQKGKVFHAQCFTEHGNTITMVDPDLAHLSARTRNHNHGLQNNQSLPQEKSLPQRKEVKQKRTPQKRQKNPSQRQNQER